MFETLLKICRSQKTKTLLIAGQIEIFLKENFFF